MFVICLLEFKSGTVKQSKACFDAKERSRDILLVRSRGGCNIPRLRRSIKSQNALVMGLSATLLPNAPTVIGHDFASCLSLDNSVQMPSLHLRKAGDQYPSSAVSSMGSIRDIGLEY